MTNPGDERPRPEARGQGERRDERNPAAYVTEDGEILARADSGDDGHRVIFEEPPIG